MLTTGKTGVVVLARISSSKLMVDAMLCGIRVPR